MSNTKKIKIRKLDLLKNAAINLRNPASVQGSTALFRMAFAAGGTTFHKVAARMKDHPEGARLLNDKPDLASLFENQKAFGEYDAGTLGRAYFDFMNHPNALPGYLLGTQHYRENYFYTATEGWDEDAVWIAERIVNTHDMMHVLADYGPHAPGEALVGFFSATAMLGRPAAIPARVLGKLLSFAPTTIGRKAWSEAISESINRGLAMSNHIPFECIYWEELMNVQVSDLQNKIGLPPFKNPQLMADQENWMPNKFVTEQISTGFGTLTRDKVWLWKMANLIENVNMSPRKLWAIGDENREILYKMFDEGVSNESLQNELASMTRLLAPKLFAQAA